jgi:hypothetical protein
MTGPKTGLTLPLPLHFLAAWLAVWLGHVLREQVDFLRAENPLLREKLGTKGIRLTDAEPRRLATLGEKLGRKGLAAVATIASPETTDRDPLYTKGFREILKQGGVKVLRLPAKSPNLTAFAERFVLSVRTECLKRIVPLGETHLRRAIAEFVQHYHHERNHQGLENALIVPGEVMDSTGKVVRRDRLGGVLGFYYHKAA